MHRPSNKSLLLGTALSLAWFGSSLAEERVGLDNPLNNNDNSGRIELTNVQLPDQNTSLDALNSGENYQNSLIDPIGDGDEVGLDDSQLVESQDAAEITNEIKDLTPFVNQSEAAGLVTDIQLLLTSEIPAISSDEKSALKAFYNGRAYEPYFVVNQDANDALDRAISLANREGLPQSRYEMPDYAGDMALAELQAAALFLRYSRDMERGIVAPRSLGSEFDFAPDGREPAELFSAFVASADKNAFFTQLEPNDPAYAALKAELSNIYQLIGEGSEEQPIEIPKGPTLKPGMEDARVVALRDRLTQLGFPEDTSEVTGSSVVASPDNSAELIAAELGLEPDSAELDLNSPTDSSDVSIDEAVDLIASENAESLGEELGSETNLMADDQSDPIVLGNNLEEPVVFNPALYDPALEESVRQFQEKAGLTVDGIVGPATISYLNSGPKDHLKSILVGMERHRWGPQNRSGRRIFVNIANFMAEVRDDNQKVFETVVVVGKNDPQYRTPEFNDTMTHLIVNPKWNVPQSISTKEYLPKIQRDPGILKRQNITMRIKGSGQVVSPYQIDMKQFTVDDFPFLLQQQSGDGNALGHVKFMFPNSHNIYLHDTPSKSLFGRSIRTFSHGCVRVRDPEDMATVLLSPQSSDPRGKYREYLASGKERQVNLSTPIPIYLTYFTAYLNNNGQISYAPDSYGRDNLLAKALEEKGLQI